jgi:hypothetical protein
MPTPEARTGYHVARFRQTFLPQNTRLRVVTG